MSVKTVASTEVQSQELMITYGEIIHESYLHLAGEEIDLDSFKKKVQIIAEARVKGQFECSEFELPCRIAKGEIRKGGLTVDL